MAVSAVVVDLLTASGVDTTLCSNGVRTARSVVVGENLHVVTELAEGSSGSAASQAGTDDHDAELTTVQRRNQIGVILLVLPVVLHGDLVTRGVIGQNLADLDPVDSAFRRAEVRSDGCFSVSHSKFPPRPTRPDRSGRRLG